MDVFKIQIAGYVFAIEPLYESTRAYCHNYLSEADAMCHFQMVESDLLLEQQILDAEARDEGLKLRKFTGPFLERTAIQRKLAEELLKYDTLLLHGSTVAVDGAAYLFTAACGTGKSTHTRLWREVFEDRAVMINDDKPFLQFSHNGVIAYGSPWSGKHGLDTNISAPLHGICILKRGVRNEIRRVAPDAVTTMLQHQAFFSMNPTLQERTQILVEKLVQTVPLWEMECTKDRQAAEIAHAAMSTTV